MRHVMPSQVTKQIEELFPQQLAAGPQTTIGRKDGTLLKGVLAMVDAVPGNLWISDADYSDLLLAKNAINQTMDAWNAGRGGPDGITAIKGKNVVALLHDVLSRCPDEHAPPPRADLAFIEPEEVREAIRGDVGGAYRALQHEEWKAANILAGAAIEALLFWKLRGRSKADREKAASAPKGKTFTEWNLADMISVARDLQILTEKQATAADLAKGYRNLIHPGVAERLRERSTRFTAQQAIAGMEAVIEALSPCARASMPR
jgi:hypothetical protein